MAEKFYNYPGYIEVVGFESMRDQVEDAAQKVIAENNAVDAAQSEKIAQNTDSINSEVVRSKSADAEFENDLALEIDERKRMGGILNTKISDEASIRESADKALEVALNDLNKHVSEGFDAVNDAIEINEQHISAVKEHVEKVHNELSDKLAIEESTRQIKDEELSKVIAEEASIREQNDQAIRDLIDDQKASRIAADEELSKLIAEEASVRENNDKAIRDLIDDQKMSRDAIVAELKVVDEDLARLIKEEASTRDADDEKLESAIDGMVVKVASLQKELNEEIKYLKKELESLRKEIEPLKVSNNSMIAIKEINSLKEGEVLNLSLDTDLVLDERIEIANGASVNINLNGKTIKSNIDDIIFRVDGNLVIEGEGKIETVGYGASANEGSTVIIKNGSHKCSTTCYQSNGGILTIEGGFFNAYNEQYNGKYTINFIDKMYKDGIGDIIVNGGTFVGYNPMNSESEFPAATFVQEGYHVEEVVVDGISQFTVVKD